MSAKDRIAETLRALGQPDADAWSIAGIILDDLTDDDVRELAEIREVNSEVYEMIERMAQHLHEEVCSSAGEVAGFTDCAAPRCAEATALIEERQ